MNKARLEAFSDGVIAIIITIMVLELKVPHDSAHLADLRPLLPVFLGYVLSFIYVGIYWTNHHHMLHATSRVTGGILWANLHLLFWMSLIPFVTGWVGENRLAPIPTASYGVVLFMSGIAYFILAKRIVASEGADSVLARAIGRDWKGKVSVAAYGAAVLVALSGWEWASWGAIAMYVAVAMMWLIPDRRIERELAANEG